ncbi:uncharacterized protein BJ171DRAFT_489275 [Polychytrium aggregatum]|uniref:uncharacterized protein n=1 Tax=Polychytrium aggregatum TaxID=110093 RepID=UPI0022FF3844|nr:uncharacterized protein BJ171DRAFT_489275 [Polychytrium aggregatum]KAI9208540.1 hypothetical protein BJ171DRAFT_489275 [Polychytrium aggregatum]
MDADASSPSRASHFLALSRKICRLAEASTPSQLLAQYPARTLWSVCSYIKADLRLIVQTQLPHLECPPLALISTLSRVLAALARHPTTTNVHPDQSRQEESNRILEVIYAVIPFLSVSADLPCRLAAAMLIAQLLHPAQSVQHLAFKPRTLVAGIFDSNDRSRHKGTRLLQHTMLLTSFPNKDLQLCTLHILLIVAHIAPGQVATALAKTGLAPLTDIFLQIAASLRSDAAGSVLEPCISDNWVAVTNLVQTMAKSKTLAVADCRDPDRLFPRAVLSTAVLACQAAANLDSGRLTAIFSLNSKPLKFLRHLLESLSLLCEQDTCWRMLASTLDLARSLSLLLERLLGAITGDAKTLESNPNAASVEYLSELFHPIKSGLQVFLCQARGSAKPHCNPQEWSSVVFGAAQRLLSEIGVLLSGTVAPAAQGSTEATEDVEDDTIWLEAPATDCWPAWVQILRPSLLTSVFDLLSILLGKQAPSKLDHALVPALVTLHTFVHSKEFQAAHGLDKQKMTKCRLLKLVATVISTSGGLAKFTAVRGPSVEQFFADLVSNIAMREAMRTGDEDDLLLRALRVSVQLAGCSSLRALLLKAGVLRENLAVDLVPALFRLPSASELLLRTVYACGADSSTRALLRDQWELPQILLAVLIGYRKSIDEPLPWTTLQTAWPAKLADMALSILADHFVYDTTMLSHLCDCSLSALAASGVLPIPASIYGRVLDEGSAQKTVSIIPVLWSLMRQDTQRHLLVLRCLDAATTITLGQRPFLYNSVIFSDLIQCFQSSALRQGSAPSSSDTEALALVLRIIIKLVTNPELTYEKIAEGIYFHALYPVFQWEVARNHRYQDLNMSNLASYLWPVNLSWSSLGLGNVIYALEHDLELMQVLKTAFDFYHGDKINDQTRPMAEKAALSIAWCCPRNKWSQYLFGEENSPGGRSLAEHDPSSRPTVLGVIMDMYMSLQDPAAPRGTQRRGMAACTIEFLAFRKFDDWPCHPWDNLSDTEGILVGILSNKLKHEPPPEPSLDVLVLSFEEEEHEEEHEEQHDVPSQRPDNRHLRISRKLLSAASPMLMTMCYGAFAEAQQTEVHISSGTMDIWLDIACFIQYSSRLPMHERISPVNPINPVSPVSPVDVANRLIKLAHIADQYLMVSLFDTCLSLMERHVQASGNARSAERVYAWCRSEGDALLGMTARLDRLRQASLRGIALGLHSIEPEPFLAACPDALNELGLLLR